MQLIFHINFKQLSIYKRKISNTKDILKCRAERENEEATLRILS